MPLKSEEIETIRTVADAFTAERVRSVDRVTQAKLAGRFLSIGNSVDPALAQLLYANMYSLAVDQDAIPDAMVEDHCETIQAGIRILLERAGHAG